MVTIILGLPRYQGFALPWSRVTTKGISSAMLCWPCGFREAEIDMFAMYLAQVGEMMKDGSKCGNTN